MKKKIRVGIIFGGKSVEHEVSLQSAKGVFEAIDKKKYEPVLIGMDKQGKWHLQERSKFLLNSSDPKLIKLQKSQTELAVSPGGESGGLIDSVRGKSVKFIDVAFPLIHGGLGEDGSLQGMLRLMDIPFVGASVLGSALGMDKDIQKQLLKTAGITVAKHLTFYKGEKIKFNEVKKNLGLPMFIKPANTGSSVGVSKVKNEKEFRVAIKEAFLYENKIVVEKFIKGREIEVSVLGNEHPRVSVPGEVIPTGEFYSYEAKYIDENGARLDIPAKLPKGVVKKLQATAVQAFKVLQCSGMGRVDFFVSGNKIVLNEINTIPGFTKISMYPKLWAASGINYTQLIDRLIQLAIERHNIEKKLKTSIV